MNVHSGPTAPTFKPATDPAVFWRRGAIGAAAVGLVAVGALTATLWQRPAAPVASPVATAAADPSAIGQSKALPAAPATQAHKPAPLAAARAPAHTPATTAAHAGQGGTATTPLQTQPAGLPAPGARPAPAPCATCGVVESVTAVTHKGEGSGIGAVAGGVLGGVVGHQIGGGKGRDAMTVLGAIGGGLAGNEIEKRQRATTDYRVTVRMADGSQRTVTQAHAPAVGQAVQVDGDRLTVVNPPARSAAPGSDAADGELRTLQTGQRS